MDPETSVDDDIIRDVAESYSSLTPENMRDLLTSPHLDKFEDDSVEIQAVEEAYSQQRQKDNLA